MTARSGDAHLELERERKFLLPGGVTLPPLDRLGPASPTRTLHLRAEYFDTPQLDLAGAGVTLRRRTGGDDDGWHLKTPGPDGARLEHRLPIGAPRRIPASLRATVADVVGDHPVLPLLLMTTTRRVLHVFGDSGRVRLEVAVDDVTAQPPAGGSGPRRRWREVEVELAAGEPQSTLDEASALLAAAGLLPAPHSSKLQQALGPRASGADIRRATAAGAIRSALCRDYGRFQALEARIAADEPDAVHKARVALRRMRSILRVFGRTLSSAGRTELLGELRWAGGLLGGPRDTEVLIEVFDELASEGAVALDEELRESLTAHLATRHDAARDLLLTSMATPRWDALHERIVGLLHEATPTRAGLRPASPGLRHMAGRAVARVERRHRRALRHPEDPTLWHAVRKAAKAARYAHEVVADLSSGHAADVAAAEGWKDVTTAFGRFQDLVIAGEVVAEVTATAAGGRLGRDVQALAARRLLDARAVLLAVDSPPRTGAP